MKQTQSSPPVCRVPEPLFSAGDKAPNPQRSTWAMLGPFGVGLACAVCCAAPAIGLAMLTGVGAWFSQSLPALALILGAAFVALLYSRRRKAKKPRCGC